MHIPINNIRQPAQGLKNHTANFSATSTQNQTHLRPSRNTLYIRRGPRFPAPDELSGWLGSSCPACGYLPRSVVFQSLIKYRTVRVTQLWSRDLVFCGGLPSSEAIDVSTKAGSPETAKQMEGWNYIWSLQLASCSILAKILTAGEQDGKLLSNCWRSLNRK